MDVANSSEAKVITLRHIILTCTVYYHAGRGSGVGVRLATSWMIWGSSPGEDVFRTRPDRPWGVPSLLYNE